MCEFSEAENRTSRKLAPLGAFPHCRKEATGYLCAKKRKNYRIAAKCGGKIRARNKALQDARRNPAPKNISQLLLRP
jgi:hypothetical protein